MTIPAQIQEALNLMELSPARNVGVEDTLLIRDGLASTVVLRREGRSDGVVVSDTLAVVPGRPEVPVRIYRPPVGHRGRPAVLLLHGGGWSICSVDTHDETACQLCADSGRTVVSVEYRLAPEHPFPAPLDDCITAGQWLLDQYDVLGVDPGGIVVAGDSAGGNLAAAVALASRRGLGPNVLLQVLIYPVLDDDFATDSWVRNRDGRYGLRERQMRWYWDRYTTEQQRLDPLVAPAKAADLTGLAPAFIGVGTLDPLRDGARAYAGRLEQAGVPVVYREYDAGFHGFYSFRGLLDIAAVAAADVAAAIAGNPLHPLSRP